MSWKADDDEIILDMVLAPNDLWIMLCDHESCFLTCFGATRAMYRGRP